MKRKLQKAIGLQSYDETQNYKKTLEKLNNDSYTIL